MDTVNIKARKLAIIEAVLSIQEIAVLENFEKFVGFVHEKKEEDLEDGFWGDGTPFNKETLKFRLRKAEEDRKNGGLITQEELEKEAKNW